MTRVNWRTNHMQSELQKQIYCVNQLQSELPKQTQCLLCQVHRSGTAESTAETNQNKTN